jgi:hypothetical protein
VQSGLLLFDRGMDFELGLTLFAVKIIKRHKHSWYSRPASATARTFGERGKINPEQFADLPIHLAQKPDRRLLSVHVVGNRAIGLPRFAVLRS